MLCGILVPSGGQVTVNGRVPHRDRIVPTRQIGAVFGQTTQLWWDVPVIEMTLALLIAGLAFWTASRGGPAGW